MILTSFLLTGLLTFVGPVPPDAAIATVTDARKSGDPAKIIRAMNAALVAFEKSEEKRERARLVSTIAPLVHHRDKHNQVAVHAAMVLGNMGPSAARPIVTALKNKRLKKQEELLPVRTALIEALGATKSTKVVKTLLDLLKDRDTDVIIAAAEALANYSEAPDKLRKEITKAMIETLEALGNENRSQRGTTGIKRTSSRLLEVSPSVQASLRQVTGASVDMSVGWRQWFNENKARKWE